MKNETIEIFGVTPSCEFPKYDPDYPCTEICETDKLCIPCKKPDIKEILQVWITISVCSTKTICTLVGKKLVIDGIKHVKIMYAANNSCQSVHCAHFEVPFCSFILLGHWCHKIIDICTSVEHVCVHQLNSRSFSISSIIFMCPIYSEKKHQCNEDDCCKPHNDPYYFSNCYEETCSTIKSCLDEN